MTKRRTVPFDFNVVLPKLKCLKQPVRRCQAAKENLDKSKLTAAKTKRYKLPARLYFQILLVKNVSRVSELIAEYGIEKRLKVKDSAIRQVWLINWHLVPRASRFHSPLRVWLDRLFLRPGDQEERRIWKQERATDWMTVNIVKKYLNKLFPYCKIILNVRGGRHVKLDIFRLIAIH